MILTEYYSATIWPVNTQLAFAEYQYNSDHDDNDNDEDDDK